MVLLYVFTITPPKLRTIPREEPRDIPRDIPKDECDEGEDGICEEMYRIDTDTCNGITRVRGPAAGQRCHASASQRYAECLRYGISGVRTPLDTWSN